MILNKLKSFFYNCHITLRFLHEYGPIDDDSGPLLQWWVLNGDRFPAWNLVATYCATIERCCAETERVFSMVRRMFYENQEGG